MANPQIHNVNVADQRVLISPVALRDMIEVPDALYKFVSASRTTIEQIIDRQDHRLMVVVGPCSIHDVDAARPQLRLTNVYGSNAVVISQCSRHSTHIISSYQSASMPL